MMRFLIVFLFLVALAVWFIPAVERLPASYKFWEPLDPAAQPGPFTGYKLGRLRGDLSACEAFLERAEVEYRSIGTENRGECTLSEQVLLHQSRYPYSAPVQATCPVIAALTLWERHVVAPAAKTHLQADVERIDHYGIFACRNVRGSNRRSQHAGANAIDISGFRLANGRQVSVRRSWGEDSAEGAFLRQVYDGGCALFRTVLGPDYNAAHADHFHMDFGSYNMCR